MEAAYPDTSFFLDRRETDNTLLILQMRKTKAQRG